MANEDSSLVQGSPRDPDSSSFLAQELQPLSWKEERLAAIQRRGLSCYSSHYGSDPALDKDDPLRKLAAQFRNAVAKRLGVMQHSFTEQISWSEVVVAFAKGHIDLVTDPIFLTPWREHAGLDVIQYGVLEKFNVLAWRGSTLANEIEHGKSWHQFALHSRVTEIGLLLNTAATEEVENVTSIPALYSRLRPRDYSGLKTWFCAREARHGSLTKETRETRIVFCDIGVADLLDHEIQKRMKSEGLFRRWQVPFQILPRRYHEREA